MSEPPRNVSSSSEGGRDAPGTKSASAMNRYQPGSPPNHEPRTAMIRARIAAAMIAESA